MRGFLGFGRAVIIASAIAVFAFVSEAGAASLPDADGWTAGPERITALDSVSGNHGEWRERVYTGPGGARATATLITAKGAYLPPAGTRDSDGPIGSGATYERLTVAGREAAFEEHPLLGASLSVIADGYTLTLDASGPFGAGRAELAALAEAILAGLD